MNASFSFVVMGSFFLSPLLAALDVAAQTSTVIGWGSNRFGEAIPPAGLSNAVAVAGGFTYSLALRADGTVASWGQRIFLPTNLNAVAALAAAGGSGGSHNLALLSNGTVLARGDSCCDFGQSQVPPGLSNVFAVSAGGLHSLALKSDGSIAAWGSRPQTNTPASLSNIVAIAAGGSHSLALRSDGIVVAWGGNNLRGETNVPPGLSNVVAVAASRFSMALKSDGTVVVWGGTVANTPPSTLSDVVAIAAGHDHSLAIKSDGTVIAWGDNTYGQLNVPARATNATAVAAGFVHSVAMTRPTPAPWPRVTGQPGSQRTLVDQAVKFSVAATSSAPLSYRWQFRGRNIPDGTNATLRLDYPQLSDSGDYAVVVTADGLSVRSAPAFLAVSNPPVATPQTAEGLEDTDLQIRLGGFDPSGLPLTARIVQLPARGRLFQFGGTGRGDPIEGVPAVVADANWRVLYVPETDGNGFAFDTFLFVLGNEIGDSAPAAVTVNLQPVNDAPIAQSQQVTLIEDGTAEILLAAQDIDGDSLSYRIIAPPQRGTLSGAPPRVTYQPETNFFGQDAFSFAVNDGEFDSASASVSITIGPVNDPPVARIRVENAVIFLNTLTIITLAGRDGDDDDRRDNNEADSLVEVVFDGSQSSDVDNDLLMYVWSAGDPPVPFAGAARVTEVLEAGSYEIVLQVSDGVASATDAIHMEVISASDAVGALVAVLEEAGLDRRSKRGLTAALKAAAKAFERGRFRSGTEWLHAFQDKVQAQIGDTEPAVAAVLIESAQAIIDAVTREMDDREE